jgi:hypothetical protein
MLGCAAVVASVIVTADERAMPRLLPDDPVAIDDDTRFDASAAVRRELGRYADFVINSFRSPGDRRPVPAPNVNTLGEVPNSSWFTNRIGVTKMSAGDIARGPDRTERLPFEDWVIVEGKDIGRQLGFRAISASDPTRRMYQIEFDPRSNPEMATGAEVIGTAIYHAIGYNVVETYLIDLDISKVSIAPDATITIGGRTRPFTRRDLNSILRQVARRPNGHYRASASPFAEGKYLGPFRHYGTRPDDPNDIYPHEHRRELRGNRVFAAWLNHDDSRAGNSLDMLVSEQGRTYVKHYMFDFGALLGSGTDEEDHPWVGSEYVVQPRPGVATLASLGLWRRPYIAVREPSGLPAVGNFTADGFEPGRWRPHYPNAAFRNMQPEDAFWAARIVAAFSPESIERIVAKAQFSDPRAADHIIGALLRRREAVLRTWLTPINPVVNPRIDADHMMRFDNAAAAAQLLDTPSEYEMSWFRFDNDSGSRLRVTDTIGSRDPEIPVPARALADVEYAGVEVRTRQARYPGWTRPVRFYFRQSNGRWMPVAIERESAVKTTDARDARRK